MTDGFAAIDDRLKRDYQRDGAVCVRRAVSADTAADLLQRLDALAKSNDDRWTTNRIGGFSDRHLWPREPWMRDFCANSSLPSIAGQLMQSGSARLFF